MKESKIIECYNATFEIIPLMKELKELNIGLLSQISQLNQEIQAIREANLRLLTRMQN
jgi:hypothetical protein